MTRREASAEAIALHEACRAGHTAEVKLILQSKRVDVNARDAEGATPLCHACEAGRLDVVQILSKVGARRAHVREAAGGYFAEEAAASHAHVVEWLRSTRAWTTALHHANPAGSKPTTTAVGWKE
uniref:Uncharacterized protein n=1 Tax=Haptolina ericina TaxID=156174 RepID=A0A7S3ADA1_9EUKA|mmetsp:Transcript_12919/g.29477  ORF Transcript_12919/g.29477 Transcript_12919/m.29477 type:complete len:125 (+) Transcript_12919:79-453(+)